MSNLKFYDGDIFSPNKTGHELIVCHQVNCKGVMGAGLALQVRRLFPHLFEMYRIECQKVADSRELLGKVLYCNGSYNGYDYTVANLFSQDDYGRGKRQTDYDALRKALSNVRCVATPLPARTLTTVRIPYKLGCGLAGGDWDVVFQIITEELVSKNIPVEIWRYASNSFGTHH